MLLNKTWLYSLIILSTAGLYAQQIPAPLSELISDYQKQNIQLSISNQHCEDAENLCYYYLQQTHTDSLPLHNQISTVVYDLESDRIVSHPKITSYKPSNKKANGKTIAPQDAIKAALHKHNQSAKELSIKALKSKKNEKRYKLSSVSREDILVREVYLVQDHQLLKTFQIDIFFDDTNDWWQILVGQDDGEVHWETSYTTHCELGHLHEPHRHHGSHMTPHHMLMNPVVDSSYHVYAWPLMTPDDGARSVVQRPWITGAAIEPSPYGWHDVDGIAGADFTTTQGNNAYAYADEDNNNLPDPGSAPDGGANLSFDFPLDLNDQPQDYRDAAVTNLFYWNNILHDIFYQYGFDESAGNFQANNYGRGGYGADYVAAEALDGSGVNNANFITPPDGQMPRMQMYRWTKGSAMSMMVNGNIEMSPIPSEFTPMTTFSGELVMAEPIEGCGTITNANEIDGNIAVIDRGSCLFTEKVTQAMIAGAVGVIVCNYDDNVFAMGGDGYIGLPAVMISHTESVLLKAMIANGTTTAEIGLSTTPDKDSDLDNGVIAHEYAHGVSIRLTGGAGTSSCLSNAEQMGEGWSDYFALAMTMQPTDTATEPRGMGTYLTDQDPTSNGIRSYPYTTDMNVNPFSYADLSSQSVPHGVGSVWATILWDLHWALIDAHGYDHDIYTGTGGNNIALHLVTSGLKLQPCSPGFVDGRDAILQADELLFDGANQCLIWSVFARRGLGEGADQGSSLIIGDETISYTTPSSCNTLSVDIESDVSVASAGDTISYSIQINNRQSNPVLNLHTIDTIKSPLQILANSLNNGTLNDSVLSHYIEASTSGSVYDISYDAVVEDNSRGTVEYVGDIEGGGDWLPSSILGSNGWSVGQDHPHWGDSHYFIPNVEGDETHTLSKSFTLSQHPILSFWHRYDTEYSWDGGYVEISTNGGQLWMSLDDQYLKNGYNVRLVDTSNETVRGKMSFSGNSNGYIQSIVDLTLFAGKDVIIRFVFGSDTYVSGDGWYIDDITLYDAIPIYNTAHTSADGLPSISAHTTVYYLPNCIECQAEYECTTELTIEEYDKNSYRADQMIRASSCIPDNRSITLKSGGEIEFAPSFEVPLNAELTTENVGCSE